MIMSFLEVGHSIQGVDLSLYCIGQSCTLSCKEHIFFCHLLVYNKPPKSLEVVMVNFVCQREWAIGYPDIWTNIILGVSVRVFLDEINI